MRVEKGTLENSFQNGKLHTLILIKFHITASVSLLKNLLEIKNFTMIF